MIHSLHATTCLGCLRLAVRPAVVLVLLAVLPGFAQVAQWRVTLGASRSEIVNDGQDSVTLVCNVTDRQNQPAPDGTPVLFTVLQGQAVLEQADVMTENGQAQTKLTAAPGAYDYVTVTAICGGKHAENPVTVRIRDISAEKDRGIPNVHITADGYLGFIEGSQLFSAHGNVRFRFRRISITAEHLRFYLNGFKLQASGAVVSNGKKEFKARELYMEFFYGVTRGAALLDPEAKDFFFLNEDFVEGYWPAPEGKWRWESFGDSKIVVKTHTVYIEPDERIILKPAHIYYNNAHVFTMAVWQIALTAQALSTIPEFFGIDSRGKPHVTYPHYLTASDRQMAIVLLRSGAPTSWSSERDGIYADFDFQYSDYAGGEGRFYVDGIFAKDWGAQFTHSQQYDDRTTGYYTISYPSHRFVWGHGNLRRSFGDYSQTLNARFQFGTDFEPNYAMESAWNYYSRPFFGSSLRTNYGFDVGFGKDSFDPRTYGEVGVNAQVLLSKRLGVGSRLTFDPRISSSVTTDTLKRTEFRYGATMSTNLRISDNANFGVTYSAEHYQGSRFFNGWNTWLRSYVYGMDLGRKWSASVVDYLDLDSGMRFSTAMLEYEVRPKYRLFTDAFYRYFRAHSSLDYEVGLARQIGGQEIRLRYASIDDRVYVEFGRSRDSVLGRIF